MKRAFAVAVLLMGLAINGPAAASQVTTNAFESPLTPKPVGQLDQFVFARLAGMNVQPILCSDAVFVRRVYLDTLGTLPTAPEAREFIEDTDFENKRRLLVDRLLQRDEFADYWAMRWGDVLRIKAEFPINLWPNAAQAYHRWVRASLAENKPYDRFVREMLTASGSNFRVGPVNFYRALQNRTPEGIARGVALTFMGARAEAWPSNRLSGMSAFFSQIGYKPTGEWKEEHVFWDPLGVSRSGPSIAPGRAAVAGINAASNAVFAAAAPVTTSSPPCEAVFPDGIQARLSPERDPREVFADWLIRPENPWFTRSVVNRIWAWLLGRGIVQEPDDIRNDNPPSNPELLAYLEKEMVAGGYDLRRFYRLVLNSQVYQFSSMPRFKSPEAEAQFASYPLRRLDAEVLSDALNKISGSSDLYTSAIPEPFTYIPKEMPAIAIADGSITSPFLALFGRSARATGFINERNHKPTPAQWLYLLNSADIQRKLEQGTNLQAVIGFGSRRSSEILEDIYLTILSRFPTADEMKLVEAYTSPPAPKPSPKPKAESSTNAPGSTNIALLKRGQGTNAVPATNLTTLASNQDSNVPPVNASRTNLAARGGAQLMTNTAGTNQGARRRLIGSLGVAPKREDKTVAKTREEWFDVAWSLINSEEFLYRH